MIRPKEELREINRILVPKQYYDELHFLKNALGRPMAELQREGLIMVLEKYSKNIDK